jgi:hypothetical protein
VLVPLLAGLVLAGAGCEVGTDDELAPPPTRTITASPSSSAPPAPATVPVGRGEVSPEDVVWAQGSVLHVGGREVDLAPLTVDAFVVVRGGVFVLAGGEVWFTDLSRLRGTGQTDVSGLRISADNRFLEVVDTRAGEELTQGYDTRTGRAVRADVATQSPEQRRQGPGRFEVTTSSGSPTVVDSRTGRTIRLAGAPRAFELGAWAEDSVFLGVGRPPRGPRSVVSCDAETRRCRAAGRVTGSAPVVFGVGR